MWPCVTFPTLVVVSAALGKACAGHAGAGMEGTPGGRRHTCEQRGNCPTLTEKYFPRLLRLAEALHLSATDVGGARAPTRPQLIRLHTGGWRVLLRLNKYAVGTSRCTCVFAF